MITVVCESVSLLRKEGIREIFIAGASKRGAAPLFKKYSPFPSLIPKGRGTQGDRFTT